MDKEASVEASIEAEAVAEEDAKKRKEKDEAELKQLVDFIEDSKKRNSWKVELRNINQNVENRPEESDFYKLDSSLKKNTAFIRKLKNYSEAQAAGIKKDMNSLNLTKYIGEVASAFVEAKLKLTDLHSLLEICSFLHQRYAEFASNLLEMWQKALALKKDEKIANPSKLRVDLRFYSELISVGVFTLKAGLPLLGQVLTTLVAIDREEHAHAPLLTAFCKHCGDDYAGLVPRKMRALADRFSYEVPQSSLLPSEKQKGVRGMLNAYYTSLCTHLQREHREVDETERMNRRILLTKGEVHVERTEKAEALKASYERLLAAAEQLSELLDDDMPELTLEDAKAKDGDDDDEGELESVEPSALGPLWEDEESKSFYEELMDLKAAIPAILYKESSSNDKGLPEEEVAATEGEGGEGEDAEEQEDDATDVAKIMEIDDDEEVAPPNLDDEPEEAEATPQNTSNKMLMEDFLAGLPNCIGREMIDSAAMEFCLTLNTKNNRKKLVKHLFAVHRNRQDLLPFYARLVATLYPCMPAVAVDLAQYLKQDFRWLVRKKDQMNAESKAKCCRFIGEMVKFKMFLKTEVLFCLKMLIFDFTHHHIEMACTIMETCGRFLYRTPESHRRTKIYLEQMIRKKTAFAMDDRYSMMIENAFYNVNPPEAPLLARQARPPMQEYILKLLYHDLCKTNTEKILKQMRKLNWKDPEISAFIVKSMAEIWNVKFYNIRYVASLIAGLVFYYDFIGPQVIDIILEDVRIHMEINNSKFNQRRIADIKFLGELYNYRLVDSGLIFKVLYSLITFGASPHPSEPSLIDPPEHLLRVRLACILLDTCGSFFNTGSSKKKLDYYLIYLQRYYWRKKSHPTWLSPDGEDNLFPLGIRNFYEEVVPALRPKAPFFTSLAEAEEAVVKLEKEMILQLTEKAPELCKYFSSSATNNDNSNLGTIAEEDNDDEDEDENLFHRGDDESEDESEDSEDSDLEDLDDEEEDYSEQLSRSRELHSQDVDDEEDLDGESQEELSQELSQYEEEEEDDEEDDEEEEDDSMELEDLNIVAAPKLVECEEDDDFVNLFDKMLNDNIVESRRAAPTTGDLVAPMHAKQKKTYDQLQTPNEGVKFSVLLRKNNKPSYKEFSVPVDSEIALNLQRQEEADRREKERVKKLTLEINERQEEEDLNAAIAAMQRPTLVNTNHRRKERQDRHPKGAPDADLIFGNKKTRGGGP